MEMEQWDQKFIDMETEGYISFDEDDMGLFQFGLVKGQIDYRIENYDGSEKIEFSWQGQDENDEVSGRGWAVIKNNHLEGRFYFHMGDDSWFKANKS